MLIATKDEELDELLKLEDEVWLQRSTGIWLEGGDRNTNSSIEKLLKGIKQIRSAK